MWSHWKKKTSNSYRFHKHGNIYTRVRNLKNKQMNTLTTYTAKREAKYQSACPAARGERKAVPFSVNKHRPTNDHLHCHSNFSTLLLSHLMLQWQSKSTEEVRDRRQLIGLNCCNCSIDFWSENFPRIRRGGGECEGNYQGWRVRESGNGCLRRR